MTEEEYMDKMIEQFSNLPFMEEMTKELAKALDIYTPSKKERRKKLKQSKHQ